MNKRNSDRNRPNVPAKVTMSTHVGWNMPQLDGRKSRAMEVTMMTKRSNHMPILTNWQMMNTQIRFRRQKRNQKNCGEITLQVIIA